MAGSQKIDLGSSVQRLVNTSRWRAFCYTFSWVPFCCAMVFLVPASRPMFKKLEVKKELSQDALFFWAFVDIDVTCFHLLSIFVVVMLLALNEFLMAVLHLSQRNRQRWALIVSCAGVSACIILVKKLMLPVFVFPSVSQTEF